MSSRFFVPVLALLLAGCAPQPPASPPAPTAPPATPAEPVDTGADDTGDTGTVDTDEPAPLYTCDGAGDPSLLLGEELGPAFQPFAEPVAFPHQSGRLVLTLRTEGLDTTEPVLVVVRVGEPGAGTTDTIGQRYLNCLENHGWIEIGVGIPQGVQTGDPLVVTATLTDHRQVASSAERVGYLD